MSSAGTPSAKALALEAFGGHSTPGWGSWSLSGTAGAVALALLLAGSCAYFTACQRARARGHFVGASRWLPFTSGALLSAIALYSPVDAVGDSWLLSVHMLQHLLLAYAAPGLIVLGLRAPVLGQAGERRAARDARAATRDETAKRRDGNGLLRTGAARIARPWVAVPAASFAIWVWSIPALFDFASTHPLLHGFEHLTLFAAGATLWWMVFDPRSRAARAGRERVLLLGFASVAATAACVPLLLTQSPVYPLYARGASALGVAPVTDERLAAALAIAVYALGFAIAAARAFQRSRRATRGALARAAQTR